MKKKMYIFIISILTSLIVGCGGGNLSEGKGGGTEGDSKGTIGVSVLTLGNPFFSVIAEGVREEAAKHGYDVVVVDGDRDVQKQANQIDDFLTKGVDAIILNPCDRQSIGPAIEKANNAGVPVFTCDLKCVAEDADVVSHVGSDNLQGGKLAGEAMIEALGVHGGEVLIVHFPQANSCQLRVQGFEEVIGKYNQGLTENRIEVVAQLDGGGVRDEGYKVTEDTLQAHPNLRGVFAINDPSGLGARAALEKADKQDQVVIVAFDGQPEGKQAIKDGKIFADPIQFPDLIGKKTVELMMEYFAGKEVEKEVLIPTKLYRQADGENDPSLK
ncbi:MAG: substrate-binding domain-containing protein [Opitutae bacterium]|nr:substrate-binding domain-containing protein [Opitutae bacterium]